MKAPYWRASLRQKIRLWIAMSHSHRSNHAGVGYLEECFRSLESLNHRDDKLELMVIDQRCRNVREN